MSGRCARRVPASNVARLPAYAPELNPDEFVWAHLTSALANGRPDSLRDLLATLSRLTRRLSPPDLLRAFIFSLLALSF